MRLIDGFSFPETEKEARNWENEIRWLSLASKIIIVATTRIQGGWRAYIGTVPGIDHEKEYEEVFVNGNRVVKEIAVAAFPEFKNLPYSY